MYIICGFFFRPNLNLQAQNDFFKTCAHKKKRKYGSGLVKVKAFYWVTTLSWRFLPFVLFSHWLHRACLYSEDRSCRWYRASPPVYLLPHRSMTAFWIVSPIVFIDFLLLTGLNLCAPDCFFSLCIDQLVRRFEPLNRWHRKPGKLHSQPDLMSSNSIASLVL